MHRALVISLTCLALPGYSVPESKIGTPRKTDCQNLYRILGVSLVAGSLVAAGLSYLGSDSGEQNKLEKRKNKTQVPKVADVKLSDLKSDKEFYSRASDLADYLVDKYKEEPNFSASLRRFLEQHPQEGMTALSVRHGLREKNPQNAKQLLAELGPKAFYSLTFAWIISAVYNETEKGTQKTLRDIIVDIEQEIEAVDYYTD